MTLAKIFHFIFYSDKFEDLNNLFERSAPPATIVRTAQVAPSVFEKAPDRPPSPSLLNRASPVHFPLKPPPVCIENCLNDSLPSIRLIVQRAKQGDAEACYTLYQCYHDKKVECAQNWLEKACQLGHPEALKMMQQEVTENRSVAVETKKSQYGNVIQIIQKAHANDPKACFTLFKFYTNYDDATALDWLDRAAQLDYLPALLEKASLLESGLKYKLNPQRASFYFRKAKQIQTTSVP